VRTENVSLDELQVEKDEGSTARLERTARGTVFSYHLAEATPERPDRWVALALRKEMDLSRFSGFFIEAESVDVMRYWVEVRSGAVSRYSSFKLRPGGQGRQLVPFGRFYSIAGGREPIPLETIDSLFITVNTSNSRTGFSSEFTVKEMGFYGP
jgi:hypothetical protein